MVFSPTNRWSNSTVRLSIRWSRPAYRKSYYLQDHQYVSRDQCVVSLLYVGLSIRWSKAITKKVDCNRGKKILENMLNLGSKISPSSQSFSIPSNFRNHRRGTETGAFS